MATAWRARGSFAAVPETIEDGTKAMDDLFHSLIHGFLASHGLETDEDATGLSFITDDLSVFVMAHPGREGWLMIELQIGAEDVPNEALSAETLLLLHSMNDIARFEHDWIITVGRENTIYLHCSRAIASIDVATLTDVITDGLQRCESLRTLLRAREGAQPLPASSAPAIPLGSDSFIILRV